MSAYNQGSNHFVRLYKATGYSIQGLKSTFRYEQAFRLEVYILVILIPLAFWLGNTPIEYCFLIGSWLFVMIVELLNSAVEAAIDRIGMEKHELSGRAKDIGSAAVMVSVFLALGIWVAFLL
ncbi:MAG: diacylglycerol kinase [Cellvibrionaceae bacterium]